MSIGGLGQIVIAFSGPVVSADLHAQSVRMLVPDVATQDEFLSTCWCQFPAVPEPWNLTTPCNVTGGGAAATGATCNAVALNVNIKQLLELIQTASNAAKASVLGSAATNPINNISNSVRIQVYGDMIADAKGNGLDGNQLPPFLPTKTTGDGIPGGLFESWFIVET
jgi:hypothetical protein